MEYTSKTNWQNSETVVADDMNRIEYGIDRLGGYIDVEVPVSGWSGDGVPCEQTIQVPSCRANYNVQIALAVTGTETADQIKKLQKLTPMINDGETLDGSIKVKCLLKRPTETFKIRLIGLKEE